MALPSFYSFCILDVYTCICLLTIRYYCGREVYNVNGSPVSMSAMYGFYFEIHRGLNGDEHGTNCGHD